MADERVRDVQNWLNQTYGGVSGFEKAPTDGKTGWETIYSLREALQKELKVSPLGQGFGDKTRGALQAKIGDLKVGYNGRIAKIIKGAFWCKGAGYSPSNFSEDYDDALTVAVKNLQADAGVKIDGKLTVNLMAALFDMSAFKLIYGRGDDKTRAMQQYLNGKFSNDLGILPCDGIYQRETNTALIFALQKAIGVPGANGNYGEGTIKATPTIKFGELNPGEKADLIKVIQYGLYVNGFYKSIFDGLFSSEVANSVIDFRKFMNLPPFTGDLDLTVIKGLLTSNGNTARGFNAVDTATQLSVQDVSSLKKAGITTVGRYLTGSVGTGQNKKDKNLTLGEIQRITSAGLSIFPLYEELGYDEEYINASQGYTDGFLASKAAHSLGFPSGTTIYFAVDVDIQDGDIAGTVEPYVSAIIAALANSGYQAGIYGTRNVCLHGEALGMKYSFVADMSYGWSGNLGFKMPENWTFDQFSEQPIDGVSVDHVSTSGKDGGTSEFESPKVVTTITPEDALKVIGDDLKATSSKLTFNKEITLIDDPALKVTVEAESEFKGIADSPIFTVKNGKLDSASVGSYLKKQYGLPKEGTDFVINTLGKGSFSSKIDFGGMSYKMSAGTDGKYKISVTYNVQEVEGKTLTSGLSVTMNIEVHPINFVKEKVKDGQKISQSILDNNKVLIGIIIVVGIVGAIALGDTAPEMIEVSASLVAGLLAIFIKP